MSDGKWAQTYTGTATQTPDLLGTLNGLLVHGIHLEGNTSGNTLTLTLDGIVVYSTIISAAGQQDHGFSWVPALYSSVNPIITVGGLTISYFLYYSVH